MCPRWTTGSTLTATRRPAPNRRLRAKAVRPWPKLDWPRRADADQAMPAADAGLGGGAQHLGDETARVAGGGRAALDLARPDAELAVLAHGCTVFRPVRPMVP